MITADELAPIGVFSKTHGIKGEINAEIETDFDVDGCDYFIMDMEGIFVPFFIETLRFRSDTTAIVKFEDIDTEKEVRPFTGKTIYIKKELLEDDSEQTLNIFGYAILNEQGNVIGKVDDIDTTTINTLIISGDNMIPLAAVEIIDVNHKLHTITLQLPEGLLDINK